MNNVTFTTFLKQIRSIRLLLVITWMHHQYHFFTYQ